MLAISCKKNEATDPGTFSPSQASGNVFTTIVKHATNSDGSPTFNSEITINFSEARNNQFNTSLANAFGNSESRDLTNNVEIGYTNGKVTFDASIITNLKDAQTNTYKLTFSLANNTGLNNPTRSIDIDVSLIKTKLVDSTMISNAVSAGTLKYNSEKTSSGSPKYIFDLTKPEGSKYEDKSVNFKAATGGGAGGDTTLSVQTFTNELHQLIVADTKFQEYFSDIAFTNSTISSLKNTLDVSFIKDSSIEQTNQFQMIFELDKGKWE